MKSVYSNTQFPRFPHLVMGICLIAMHLVSCNYGVIDLDVQGHRGCRGLMPENSIPAFKKAIELGVTTLELDVVVTRDRQVVVSHEAWFSHEFCLNPDGQSITESEEKQHNIYQMDYAELSRWDCGTKIHPRFPGQSKIKVQKPLLSAVFEAVEPAVSDEEYLEESHFPQYNIEIKMEAGGEGVYHPSAHDFVALVLQVVADHGVGHRSTIQSFDLEALREARRQDREIALGLLIEENEDYKDKLSRLGFYPEVLSPEWHLVNQEMLTFAAEKNMKVVPWTVNETDDMRKIVRLGVHGIITDYPDRLIALLQEL